MVAGVKENDLIKDVQSGSREAMNILIGNYYQAVFAYFYKNTSKYHQSKDLTQEVFIKMVSGISRYRPKASFKSWLFTIASNHLKNYYRLLSRHPEYLEISEDVPASETVVSEVEIKNDIKEALAHLPPEQKETIILRFYNDFTIKEISKITGAMETTVKARIRYGLEKLKKELEGYDEKGR
ncbi:MAG: RNA polymerase sigma factor [Lachnospiraceae bacterium]|nr:RNA polymerase sigma factor [Lachnospiraceae bacterium]